MVRYGPSVEPPSCPKGQWSGDGLAFGTGVCHCSFVFVVSFVVGPKNDVDAGLDLDIEASSTMVVAFVKGVIVFIAF